MGMMRPWWYSDKWFRHTQYGATWRRNYLWYQKILGFNRHVPWPVSPLATVNHPENVYFDPTSLVAFQSPGCYFNASDRTTIIIRKDCRISQGVGLITCDHDPTDLDTLCNYGNIEIGDRCWICMNAVICPGVTLLPGTVVGANSVVKRSPERGRVLLAGAPARVVKVYA